VWHDAEAAAAWDEGGAQLLPTRAEQQALLLDLLAEAQVGDGWLLDLGVGSGLVAEAALDALPEASLVGVDFSEPMLARARARLERFGSRVTLLRHDLAALDRLELPRQRYAAAFSVQTLHHLDDAEKAAALRRSARAVRPGGLVVVVDQVSVPPSLFRDWAAAWRRIDPAAPVSYSEYAEQLRQAGDRPGSLQDHLRWFADAGMDATCLHAYGNRVLLAGRTRSG
jgi:ubiquinone/menaquinone biosynthesis C-methylase UbiE